MKRHHIIVCGSIGVGKTSVVRGMVDALPAARPFFEERDLYLARFYAEPEKYAFLNQLAYSLQYLEQAVQIMGTPENVVQDRSIYDTHSVFSRWRLQTGLIDRDEFAMLDRIAQCSDSLARPTLMVFLRATVEVAMTRVAVRGTPTEVGLEAGFLQMLSAEYERWFGEFEVCRKLALNTDSDPVELVVEKILSRL